jgi:hypothetical protein
MLMVELLKLAAMVLTLLHLLGPWGSLALVVVIVAVFGGLYAFGDHIWEWFIRSQSLAIGKVMRDATVTIHAVTSAEEPDPSVWRTGDDEEDDAFEEDLEASGMPDGDYAWFKIDATIAPRPDAEGQPASWEPTMVQFRKRDDADRHPLGFDAGCLVAQVEHWEDDRFAVFDHGSLDGPARLRLYIGVVPGTQDIQFFYLGETFGQLRLPATRAATRPHGAPAARKPRAESRP